MIAATSAGSLSTKVGSIKETIGEKIRRLVRHILRDTTPPAKFISSPWGVED